MDKIILLDKIKIIDEKDSLNSQFTNIYLSKNSSFRIGFYLFRKKIFHNTLYIYNIKDPILSELFKRKEYESLKELITYFKENLDGKFFCVKEGSTDSIELIEMIEL